MKIFLPLLMLFAFGVSSARQNSIVVEPLYEIAFPEGFTSGFVNWSPDNRYIELAFYEGRSLPVQVLSRIYDAVSAELITEAPKFGGWYEDGIRVLLGDAESAWVFNLATRAVEFALPHPVGDVAPLEFANVTRGNANRKLPIGAQIFVRDGEDTLAVYDAASGEQIAVMNGVTGGPYLLPTGKNVVVEYARGIGVYDTALWRPKALLAGHRISTDTGAWASADGSTLLISLQGGASQYNVWRIGEHVSDPFPIYPNPFRFSPDGSQFAATDAYGLVVYDTASGEKIDELPARLDDHLRVRDIDDDFVYLVQHTPPMDSYTILVWDRAERDYVKAVNAAIGYGMTRVDPAAGLIVDEQFTASRSYTVTAYADDAPIFERTGLVGTPDFSSDYRWALANAPQVEGETYKFFVDRLTDGATVTVDTGWTGRYLGLSWRPDGQVFVASDGIVVRFYALAN